MKLTKEEEQEFLIGMLKNRIKELETLFEDKNMLIQLRVRDKSDGKIHIVGSNVHDCLMVIDGKVEYYNLQNGEGTGGDYEFVKKGYFYDEEEE